MVGSLVRDAHLCSSISLPLCTGTLAPCCVDTAWLVWCFRAQLRLASVVAHAFNSMWRGVSFGCDPPPFGWFRVAPRSRPYSFGMIVCVASDRRAHLCTHFFARCLSTRALAHAYSLLWLARRSPGSCSPLDAGLGAVLDSSARSLAHALQSFCRVFAASTRTYVMVRSDDCACSVCRLSLYLSQYQGDWPQKCTNGHD